MISVSRQQHALILFLIVCSAVPLRLLHRGSNRRRRPTVVLILADNVGYGELGVYGGGILRGAPTPRIDRLASEGMRLLKLQR